LEKCIKHRENSEGLSCRERTCIDYGKCEYSLANRAEQAKKNLQKLFRENPDLKAAFKETIEELSTPENIEKQSKEICAGLAAIKKIHGGLSNGKEIRNNKGSVQER
jgi:hypothetical protein